MVFCHRDLEKVLLNDDRVGPERGYFVIRDLEKQKRQSSSREGEGHHRTGRIEDGDRSLDILDGSNRTAGVVHHGLVDLHTTIDSRSCKLNAVAPAIAASGQPELGER